MSRLSGQTYRKKIGNSSHLFCTVNAVRAFWGNLSALFQFHTKQHVRIWNTSNASAEPAKWGCSSPTLLDSHVNRGVKRQSSYQPAWSTRSRQWPEGWASRVLLAVKSKKKLNTVLFFSHSALSSSTKDLAFLMFSVWCRTLSAENTAVTMRASLFQKPEAGHAGTVTTYLSKNWLEWDESGLLQAVNHK